MNVAPKNRAQPLVAAGAALAMLAVSGCNFTAPQSTTAVYAPSDGIVEDVGPVLLRNILIIGTDDESDGRLVGTAFNPSDDDVDLSIRAGGATTTVTIEGGSELRFEDETFDDATLAGVEEVPGSLVDVEFQVDGDQATYAVPVLDGALEEYRDYVPGGYTAPPSEPAAPEGGDEEGE
ncbi:hypothetical protein E8P82_12865 [Arthrobacter echini]|uniref:DNA modification methylase n=1 Tax=Arthrobacter echini TaxID=1529066 RepID=A0A4S5E171_9MICC|nr:hypothetical protein [Arthrobacter echini]THJ65022.1 hypothetical protein E8P82_12865 [Arthrobacter echini]